MDSLLKILEGGGTPSLSLFVEMWGGAIPLLAQLSQTPQDLEWHAEGDVGIHTDMVLAEVYKLLKEEAAHLCLKKKQALILGALFHDIAKPLTTRLQEIDGKERVVAPRHADRGRSYLLVKLLPLGLSQDLYFNILALVGSHHEPKRLVLRESPEFSYRRLARQVDLELLYYLALADMKGRICQDQQEQVELVELFRLQAEEYGLWNNKALYHGWEQEIQSQLKSPPHDVVYRRRGSSFAESSFHQSMLAKAIADAETGEIHHSSEAVARGYQYQEGYGRLVILCGVSGSGKSTFVKENLPHYQRISLDRLREKLAGDAEKQTSNQRVFRVGQTMLKEQLRRKQRVVWDATSLRRDFRSSLLSLAADYNAMTTLVVFLVSEKSCYLRNDMRRRSVDSKVLLRQFHQSQWPYENEAHRVVYVDEFGTVIRDSLQHHCIKSKGEL